MQFDTPRKDKHEPPVVPMINVVFLLLIFFLLSAQIAPPGPFPVTPPDAASGVRMPGRDTLFISRTGELAYLGLRGNDVWPPLQRRGAGVALTIRADGMAPAQTVAAVLARLRAQSAKDVRLVVTGD